MAVAAPASRIGELIRSWRQRRSLTQLELSLGSSVSARHLSFVETGRARPSREMVLHLAERLEVPLRERCCCCWRPDTRRCTASVRSTRRR